MRIARVHPQGIAIEPDGLFWWLAVGVPLSVANVGVCNLARATGVGAIN